MNRGLTLIAAFILLSSTVLAAPWWEIYERSVNSVEESNRNFYRAVAKPARTKVVTPKKAEDSVSEEKPEFVEWGVQPPLEIPAEEIVIDAPEPVEEIVETPVTDQDHILVIAPHPDDEILCCTSVIREAVENGAPLKIVYLTDGDAYSNEDPVASQAYGERRRNESITAAQKLGVATEDLIWLGFPDGILPNLRSDVIISPYTFQKTTGLHTYWPDLAYTRDNLERVLLDIFNTYSASAIYYPDAKRDRHADHNISGKIIDGLIRQLEIEPATYKYAVHQKKFKKTEGFFDAAKAELIALFRSQFHDDWHRDFMEGFAYQREDFR